jgi:hypothetical protein
VFTFNKEGKNYAGMSILRPVAKNWIAKKSLENFELVGYEAQFKGVRKVRIPDGMTNDKIEELMEIVGAYNIGNDNVVLLP